MQCVSSDREGRLRYIERMKKNVKLALNIFLLIIIPWAWLNMVFRGGGNFSARGLWSLKFFTVLSNLFAAVAAFCWLFFRKKDFVPVLKLASAIDVSITFLVTLCFLGPLFGFPAMYVGSNLWFHLIVPLLCIAEELFLSEREITRKEHFLCLIPLILYGCGYLGNILLNGREGNDWYAFTMWGMPAAIGIFAFLLLLNLGLGVLYQKIGRHFR